MQLKDDKEFDVLMIDLKVNEKMENITLEYIELF